MNRRALLTWAAVLAAVVVGACGGDSPSSPSPGGGVVVQGVVLGDGAAFTASSGRAVAAAKNQKVTVQVEGTEIIAEVSANGTFELKGISAGDFTLIFKVDGVEIGRVRVTAEDGSEVKIVVQVQNSALVLVSIEVEGPEAAPSPSPSASPTACIVNGGRVGQGIELEGNVISGNASSFKMDAAGATAPVTVDASASAFRCIGGAKAETDAACKTSFDTQAAGAKVHVRGTLRTCSALDANVTAAEVKVQKN
jgi:hypothetical protein